MSLQAKIVAWFVVFAALTILVFVLGDYHQSTHALRVVLEARAGALARQTAAEVERRYERTESGLLAYGYAVAAGNVDPSGSVPASFSSIEIYSPRGLTWSSAPEPVAPADADGCTSGPVHFSVRVETRGGGEWRVQAEMPADAFFDGISVATARLGRGGFTAVIDPTDGSLLYDHGCTSRTGILPEPVLARLLEQAKPAAAEGRGLRYSDVDADHTRLVAVAMSLRPRWAVLVAVDYDEFAAPFVAMRTVYLGGLAILAFVALLFILRMVHHDMRRFRSIAQAAESIGHGRFNVWLPPPTDDDVGRLSLAIGRMVTRLSTSLHQMEITRSMATVGELASYLSHEIRNPLSSIRLNLQMLGRDLRRGSVPEDGEHLVGLCLSELQRLDDVVKTVLEVGRGTRVRPDATCDAHVCIQETVSVMQSKLAARGVAVALRLGATETVVTADATQLKSVLINLLLNAMEAMSGSDEKRILVTTELLGLPGEPSRIELCVADTGPGVPAHLHEKIFEPFFTTKASGNGIGLATALRILQECGGMIRCSPASDWTGGAEFVLELPLAPAKSPNRTPELMETG
jgi:signal transduction histidine kinase